MEHIPIEPQMFSFQSCFFQADVAEGGRNLLERNIIYRKPEIGRKGRYYPTTRVVQVRRDGVVSCEVFMLQRAKKAVT